MATSAGKTIALILLVVIILLLVWRLTPMCIAPLGIFTGTIKTLRTGLDSIHFWPYDFRLISLPFFSIGLLILWIVVIIWVYRDAERRGMNGLLWGLLVLIGNLIGLLIYLIVRTDTVAISGVSQSTQTTQPCPNCQKPVGLNFAYCPHCGTKLRGGCCPKCEEPVETNWKVCPHCGEKLI